MKIKRIPFEHTVNDFYNQLGVNMGKIPLSTYREICNDILRYHSIATRISHNIDEFTISEKISIKNGSLDECEICYSYNKGFDDVTFIFSALYITITEHKDGRREDIMKIPTLLINKFGELLK